MNQAHQSTNSTQKKPTRSWRALLWAGLVALGSTPVPQAVHAVEKSQLSHKEVGPQHSTWLQHFCRNVKIPSFEVLAVEKPRLSHKEVAPPYKEFEVVSGEYELPRLELYEEETPEQSDDAFVEQYRDRFRSLKDQSTPVPQAVHAAEKSQPMFLLPIFRLYGDNIVKQRDACLAAKQLDEYVDALYNHHDHDDDSEQCVTAIENGLRVFGVKDAVYQQSAIEALFRSPIAKNLPDRFILHFGMLWYPENSSNNIECLQNAGLLNNRPVIHSILTHWEKKNFKQSFTELCDWLETQPYSYDTQSHRMLTEFLSPPMVDKLSKKQFDVLKEYHDRIIANDMREEDVGETEHHRVFWAKIFLQHAIWNDKAEDFLKLMASHALWDYVVDSFSAGSQADTFYDTTILHGIDYALDTYPDNQNQERRQKINEMILQSLNSSVEKYRCNPFYNL